MILTFRSVVSTVMVGSASGRQAILRGQSTHTGFLTAGTCCSSRGRSTSNLAGTEALSNVL